MEEMGVDDLQSTDAQLQEFMDDPEVLSTVLDSFAAMYQHAHRQCSVIKDYIRTCTYH